MISKALSTSEKFAALALEAGDFAEFCQSLYPLLVSHSDDFGRLQGDPFTVKHLCHPSSPRSLPEFERAIRHLHNVKLIGWYQLAGHWFIEIQNFDPHQIGLHKRTRSAFPKFPGNSGKFPLIPSEEKGTELNLTEENRTEGKGSDLTHYPDLESGESKGPTPLERVVAGLKHKPGGRKVHGRFR